MNKTRLMELFYEICSVPSISETQGENDMAVRLHDMFMRLPYFQAHPENTRAHVVPGDPRGRMFTTALIEGKVKSPKTVILYGHFDVVGVEEFGALKPYAFDPRKYTEILKTGVIKLDEAAQRDLDSGDWLFGRGTMDMKFGVATCMEALHTVAERLESFEGNLLFLGVSDEEGNSTGMLGALPFLKALKAEKGLEYTGFIVTEPCWTDGESRSLHVASVGKVLPVFYCVGRSGHVSDPYGGLNPNLLVGKIAEKLEQNPDFCDQTIGNWSPAPMCLKQSDTKTEYNVQVPISAYAYYNLMTYTSDPDEVLERMLALARESFDEVTAQIAQKYERYVRRTGLRPARPSFETKVLTYGELYRMCLKAHGDSFDAHMRRFVEDSKELDFRVLSVQVVEEAHKFCPDRDPMIVVSFAPPYYPNSAPVGARVQMLCEKLTAYAADELGETFAIDHTFNGISDMSYLNISPNVRTDTLHENFPLWGSRYSIPVDLIRELAFPFVNIGGVGADAHRHTERLYLPYSLGKAPEATWKMIELMLTH